MLYTKFMPVRIFFLFILGASFGSFLNVTAERLAKEEKITGRSHCPHCGHKLGFFDLIPLLSFIFLKHSCRYCGEKFSWQYFFVELCTGILFAAVGYLGNLSILGEISGLQIAGLILKLVIASCAIILFLTDLKYKVVPESVVLTAVIAAVFLRLLEIGLIGLIGPIAAGLGAGGFFLLFHLAGRAFSPAGWMGFGDVELAFLLGLLTGWPAVLPALFFSFLTGALVSITLILKKEKEFKQTVPFGPFLIVGTLFALVWGDAVVKWYVGLL